MTRPQATETQWAERVRAWRESGESAHDFARRHGFAASKLHGWSSRLSQKSAPRFLQLVPKPPLQTPAASPELIVEVGNARVRVAAGVDVALLAEVFRALGGGWR